MFGLMPNGELRQANLKMLFQKAKQYESSNFKGLYNFINFIDRLKLSSGDLGSAKLIGENDNVIRIMSIHKSKGLEFPVVFLSSTGKQFNLMDLNDSVLLHQEMGIGVKYIDYDKQIQYDIYYLVFEFQYSPFYLHQFFLNSKHLYFLCRLSLIDNNSLPHQYINNSSFHQSTIHHSIHLYQLMKLLLVYSIYSLSQFYCKVDYFFITQHSQWYQCC